MAIANWTGVADVVCLYRVTGKSRKKTEKTGFGGREKEGFLCAVNENWVEEWLEEGSSLV